MRNFQIAIEQLASKLGELHEEPDKHHDVSTSEILIRGATYEFSHGVDGVDVIPGWLRICLELAAEVYDVVGSDSFRTQSQVLQRECSEWLNQALKSSPVCPLKEWVEMMTPRLVDFVRAKMICDEVGTKNKHIEPNLSSVVSSALDTLRRPIQMPMISTTPELLRKTREIPITEFNKLLGLLGKAGDVRLQALVNNFQADVRNRGRQINPTLVGAFAFVDQNVVLLKRLHRIFKFWWKRRFGGWVWHGEGKGVSVILKGDTSVDKLLYAIDKVVQLELNAKHGLFFAEEAYAKDNKELSAEYNQIVKTWLKEIALPRLKLEEAIKAI